jgi:hypothetical protein
MPCSHKCIAYDVSSLLHLLQGEAGRVEISPVSSAALDRDVDALQALSSFTDSSISMLEQALLAAGGAPPGPGQQAAAEELLDLSVLVGSLAGQYVEHLQRVDAAVAGMALT